MSRHIITVAQTATSLTDPEAVIGYDRPLQTFFLQAFPDEAEEDTPVLWLGTEYRAFEALPELQAAALAEGYDFMPLDDLTLTALAIDVAMDATRKVRDALLDPLGLNV